MPTACRRLRQGRLVAPDDAFEPGYSPRIIEFWLEHFEELATLTTSSKGASAHIAEHLAREWILLQVRLKTCLCHEMHAIDSLAVDPGCTHSPSGGGAFKAGPETAVCISADLTRAGATLPGNWLATHKVWRQMLLSEEQIKQRRGIWRKSVLNGQTTLEPEPIYSRGVVIRRMAKTLGWSEIQNDKKLTLLTNVVSSEYGKQENGEAAL